MIRPLEIAVDRRRRRLGELPSPLVLDRLVPGASEWEVEVGFGKGRYLVDHGMAEPECGFVGIERAREYFRILVDRVDKRSLCNVVAIRGEAELVMATVLPRRFATAAHVYFPDPWPKSRHEDRRFFSPTAVDLLVGLLRPGGTVCFATDHLDYGISVERLLGGHPLLSVRRRGPWTDGPRTNYEAKYVSAGRRIMRLEATRRGRSPYRGGVAPAVRDALVAGYRREDHEVVDEAVDEPVNR